MRKSEEITKVVVTLMFMVLGWYFLFRALGWELALGLFCISGIFHNILADINRKLGR